MTSTSDPSESTVVENLRPKTVPDQLLALGTVCQVSDIQVRLQITGGIVCLVDRYNINSPYTEALKQYEADYRLGKQPLIEPPRLSELFTKGEQYVCKIIDRQTRKGYAEAQDIIATLMPELIQEDTIPSALLAIPYVPLQGAISSKQDHGFCVDIGFKNITGFLAFDECEDHESFLVGQVIRCCTNEVLDTDTARVVQLTMKKTKESKFSEDKCQHHSLTPKLISPGSSGYLTVMKVQKDGLIVNFLDEFAGFVGLNHLENDWQDPRKSYKISDRKKCTVLYYNAATNTFSLSLKKQKIVDKTIAEMIEEHHVGQILKNVQVAFLNGLRSVHLKVKNFKGVANVKDALDQDVATMTKDELHLALDEAFPDGSKHKARVKSINYADLMLVLSLRQDFLELSCVSVDELEPSDFLEVQIKKYVKDGIVVCFGLNLRAIILNHHLKDYISSKSYKRYPIGMELKCRVLKIDPDKSPTRVYLTNKDQLMDPEMTIVDAYDKTFRGETVSAIVVKLKTNGIIVELFNNVKGFIPQRFCSNTRVRCISDLFEVGQVVTCTVYRVESHRQSMALSIIPYEKIVEMKKEQKKAKEEKKKLKERNKVDRRIDQATETNGGKTAALKKQPKSTVATPVTSSKQISKNGQQQENITYQDVSSLTSHQKGNKRKSREEEEEEEEDEDEEEGDSEEDAVEQQIKLEEQELEQQNKKQKSRLQRSQEAKEREEMIRETERKLLDPNRPAQSIGDFERLVLKSPNSADVWIKYSKFFLDNVETEKARIVCRRALKTINFRMEKEKLKLWLHLIFIEAKYGGLEKLYEIIEEAAQTNDKFLLYQRASKVLITCGELDEADKMYDHLIRKLGGKKIPDIWIEYVTFLMENKKDITRAREIYDQVVKQFDQQKQHQDCIHFRSRYAHLEFKLGDAERGKTLFENLISEYPKRKDLVSVYEGAKKKYCKEELESETMTLESV